MRQIVSLLLLAALSSAFALGPLPPGSEYRSDGRNQTSRAVVRVPFKLGPVTTTTQTVGEASFTLQASADGSIKLVNVGAQVNLTTKATFSLQSGITTWVCGYYEVVSVRRFIRFNLYVDGKKTAAYTDQLQRSRPGDVQVTLLSKPWPCDRDTVMPPL